MFSRTSDTHPHQDTRLLRLGSDLKNARRALILLHGRGAGAEDMLGLAQSFSLPADLIVLAPQAAGNVWYPQPLTAPLEANEPYLSSALRRVGEVVALLEQSGISSDRVMLGGFSQGASLAIEWVLRSRQRWGGLLAFSGGHIWPQGQPRPLESDAANRLDGTPALLGCSNVDPYIPLARVQESAALLAAMGAQVDQRIYPGMGHTVNADEIEAAQAMIDALA